jgi:hypothetical protein
MSEDRGRYLDLLNLASAEEAYAEVKKLASHLSDQDHHIRSCIFDIHAAVENELRRIFHHTFHRQLFIADDEEKNFDAQSDFERMIRRLGFSEMHRMLRPILKHWPYPDLEHIGAINDTRNQAAHGGDTTAISYRGRNPFRDADCFAQMYFDAWSITQSLRKFFDLAVTANEVRLGRYVGKYGPDLLW